MRTTKIQLLAEVALFAALAYILDLLTQPLKVGPWISFSFKMIPVFIAAFRWGSKAGMLTGFLWGLLQVSTGQATVLNISQAFLEYFIAFSLCGTAGLVKPLIDRKQREGNKWQTLASSFLGIFIGSFSRYAVHFAAGLMFWGSYAPKGSSVLLYSLTVNGSSWIGETLACILTIWLLQPFWDFFLTQHKT